MTTRQEAIQYFGTKIGQVRKGRNTESIAHLLAEMCDERSPTPRRFRDVVEAADAADDRRGDGGFRCSRTLITHIRRNVAEYLSGTGIPVGDSHTVHLWEGIAK